MRIPRLFAPMPLPAGGESLLPQAASDHALRVLRLRAGDRVQLFDGAGNECDAEVLGAEGRRARVRLGAALSAAPPSPLHVTLIQGIARGERMDLVLQKATELGVARLVPVLCTRSVVQLDERQRARRAEHWHSIVIAACEQCGRSELPSIAPPAPLPAALQALPPAAEVAGSTPASELRVTLDPRGAQPFTTLIAGRRSLLLLVGPEGGLDEAEVELARRHGFSGARLGPRVLRTETAPLAALAIAQAVAGDLG